MKKVPSILISGDKTAAADLKGALEGIIKNLKIDISDPGEKKADAAAGKAFDLIISLPAPDGMKETGLFSKLRDHKISTPIIIVFDKGGEKELLRALSDGADFYVQENKKTAVLAEELGEKINRILSKPGEDKKCEDDPVLTASFMESPDGIMIFDESGRFKSVNPAACMMTGYTEEEFLNLSIPDVHALAPESERGEEEKFIRLIKTGRLESEFLFRRKDGSEIFMEINAVRIAPGEYISFCRDITGKREFLDALKESEDRYRKLFNGVPDYILVHKDGEILYTNPPVSEILGLDPVDIIGKNIMEFVVPEYLKTTTSMMKKRAEGEPIPPYEIEILTKYGPRITEVRGSMIKYEGRVASLIVMTDITDKRHAEEYTRLLASMSDNAPASIIVHDFDGNILYVNEETLRLHGFSRDEFLKMNLADLDLPESKKLLPDRLHELREKRELDFDVEHYRKDGSSFPLHVNVRTVDWEGKEVLLNIATDITERKYAEDLLIQQNVFLQQLIDTIPNPIYYKDTDEIYLGCNRAFEEFLGLSKDEIIGKSIFDLSPKELADFYWKKDQDLFKNPGKQDYEVEARYADGSLHDVIFYKATFNDIHGNVAGLVGVFLDILDRKRSEEALQKSEEKFRTYIGYANEGIMVSDPSGRYIDTNPAGCKLTGYAKEEILKLKIQDLLVPNDLNSLKNIPEELDKKGYLEIEIQIKRKDGDIVPVIVNVVKLPDGNIMGILTDVSNMKRAEDGLKEANRKLNLLSSITRHDILNQLTGIIAFLEMIEMDEDVPGGSDAEKYLKKISGAAQTIRRQILFTKDYKDLGEQAPKWQNIRRVVDDTAKTSSFGTIKVENNLDDLEIYADPLFEKIIYNLFDNAVKHGEKITKIAFEFEDSPEGAILVCEDDGMGVPEEFKEKIFTREHYKNTGLGLFLSREILAITGLSIKETGVYGKGARFEISLPAGTFRFE